YRPNLLKYGKLCTSTTRLQSRLRLVCQIILELTQDCDKAAVLSSLLFSLFLNDLSNCLVEGMWMCKTNIRVLMYADDIMLIATQPKSLQKMSQKLEVYRKTWNLMVNLNKS
ncbi:hypothetical protein AAG570_013210, partial [Ranatra chinensis]